ncbi:MAG: pseudouridylate synthase [Prevotellaceae bacterium]|nr:pseudouridylate synthase [Prevotellaceae bacterium]
MAVTTTRVEEDNIFVEDGALTEPGLLENIAQTAAARMGYICKYVDKTGVKIGVIGEIKNLVIKRCPCVGEELTTIVEIVTDIFSTLMVQCKVNVNGTVIAQGSMKISVINH